MILTIQMPRSSFDDVFFKLGHPGYGYHLPSRWELTGVSPTAVIPNMIPLLILLMSTRLLSSVASKKTFANDYFSSGNGVCYALRFKQGTGNPIDDSSLSDFPLATDNNMVCAYRYTRVGSFANHDFTSLLKVDCVYLGSAFTGNISTINNDSWWDSHTSVGCSFVFSGCRLYLLPNVHFEWFARSPRRIWSVLVEHGVSQPPRQCLERVFLLVLCVRELQRR